MTDRKPIGNLFFLMEEMFPLSIISYEVFFGFDDER